MKDSMNYNKEDNEKQINLYRYYTTYFYDDSR